MNPFNTVSSPKLLVLFHQSRHHTCTITDFLTGKIAEQGTSLQRTATGNMSFCLPPDILFIVSIVISEMLIHSGKIKSFQWRCQLQP